jgi:hypothetical protein
VVKENSRYHPKETSLMRNIGELMPSRICVSWLRRTEATE